MPYPHIPLAVWTDDEIDEVARELAPKLLARLTGEPSDRDMTRTQTGSPVAASRAGDQRRTTKERNPNVPLAPGEIRADALRCLDAGATIIHAHNHDIRLSGEAGGTRVPRRVGTACSPTDPTPCGTRPCASRPIRWPSSSTCV